MLRLSQRVIKVLVRRFSFEEIGTDDRMMYILDPDLDGVSGLGVDNDPTHGIKAPRLTGVWAKNAFVTQWFS